MEYGYARVSTKEQNEQRQIVALEEFGLDRKQIFTDKQSGKNFERTNYRKLVRRLKEGDIWRRRPCSKRLCSCSMSGYPSHRCASP